jgi:hypothetical protein
VDTNGIVSFTDPGGSHPYDGGSLPSATNPNAMIAPFWDDFVVDSSASVRTATSGSGSTATFAIEWRNVQRKADTSQRVSFSAVLAADGTVTTNYTGLDSDAEKGADAAVGIAAPAAEDGLTYSRNTPALADGKAVVFDHPDGVGALELHSLSGKVLSTSGTGISGAKVTLDPGGLSTTTASDGTYRFDGLVADTYTVSSAQNQKCPQVAQEIVDLTADTVRDLQRALDYGGMGYACAQVTGSFTPAANVLPLTGDEGTTAVTLPFAMPFHGRSYSTATVSTNGFLTFDSNLGTNTYVNPAMPSAAAPNAVVAPFWDDLEIDASASVRTDTVGTAPNRKFIVEWRNAKFRPNGPDRITFETVFTETTGEIAFNYGTLSTALQQGAAATIGIENASGTVATLFSFQEARVNSNGTITFTPHTAGTISGTTSVAVTGSAAPGLTVTLNPGGRTTVTDSSGNYAFTGVPIGEYTVQVATGTSSCAGRYAKQTVNFPGNTMDVDLSVMTAGDEFGYTCTSGSTTFIPGTVTEDWTGDEVTWQKNPPFPIKLYGEQYTSAWINANGVLAFKDPMYFGWIGPVNNELPTPGAEGQPDAAVYPQWYDWALDSSSHIATTTTGTAPNRKWVVEWRNVYRSGDTATRATFEAVFGENGTITFAYGSIPSGSPQARGSSATVGIENASGTIGFQYLYNEQLLQTGKGVTFTPSPPGAGSIAGTVSCSGATVAGATVAAAGQTTTTGADGTYRIDNVPAGTYAVIATRSGTCNGSTVDDVTVGTGTVAAADFAGTVTPAGAGYRLTEQPVTYTPADGTVLPITGDEDYKPVILPFPVTLYGQTYTTGYVDSNGLVTFEDPGTPNSDAWPIPSPRAPEEPNAAVYPFWHDWVVDSNASVRTATRGTAPNRQYVVEWRNVSSYEDPTTRTTFQVIFDEAGGYSFAYPDIDGTFLTKGGGATIGIENADGTWAIQYTYRQPVLRPGLGLRFDPPQ